MSRRTTLPAQPNPRLSMGTAFLYGAGVGLLGAAVMTLGQKVEQVLTSRPSSFVPGRTLERLLGLRARSDSELVTLNLAMHYGLGALVGGVRGLMSVSGVRGPVADFVLAGLRLATDQTLENWTGVGALPWTWPVNEQIIDLIHKSVYAFFTGYVTDRVIQ